MKTALFFLLSTGCRMTFSGFISQMRIQAFLKLFCAVPKETWSEAWSVVY